MTLLSSLEQKCAFDHSHIKTVHSISTHEMKQIHTPSIQLFMFEGNYIASCIFPLWWANQLIQMESSSVVIPPMWIMHHASLARFALNRCLLPSLCLLSGWRVERVVQLELLLHDLLQRDHPAHAGVQRALLRGVRVPRRLAGDSGLLPWRLSR